MHEQLWFIEVFWITGNNSLLVGVSNRLTLGGFGHMLFAFLFSNVPKIFRTFSTSVQTSLNLKRNFLNLKKLKNKNKKKIFIHSLPRFFPPSFTKWNKINLKTSQEFLKILPTKHCLCIYPQPWLYCFFQCF